MRRLAFLLVGLAAASCSSDTSGVSHTVVVTELNFGARTGDEVDGVEVSPGLDLDGRVSGRGDVEGCNRVDFVAPDGTQGVDNQFTLLFEAIEEIFPDTVEGLVQGSINEGRLLLMFELEGVDDFQNDDDIKVNVFLGEGRPDLSAADRIVRDQTFDVKPGTPISTTRGRIVDGQLEAGPFDVTIPIAVLNVFFDMTFHDAYVRGQMNDDGTMTGLFGGGVTTEQIMDVARMADEMQEIAVSPLLSGLLPLWVDLGKNEDGECTMMSANMLFETTTAFLYETPPPAVEE